MSREAPVNTGAPLPDALLDEAPRGRVSGMQARVAAPGCPGAGQGAWVPAGCPGRQGARVPGRVPGCRQGVRAAGCLGAGRVSGSQGAGSELRGHRGRSVAFG